MGKVSGTSCRAPCAPAVAVPQVQLDKMGLILVSACLVLSWRRGKKGLEVVSRMRISFHILRDQAARELQRSSYERDDDGTMVPDLRQTVEAFDELWHLLR